MAGIGFRLQKLLDEDSYRSTAEAYLFSAIVSSGPWLLAILSLLLISLFSRFLIDRHSVELFQCIIAYTYAGTLILSGTVQMNTTRYLADRLFLDNAEALRPCYNTLTLLTLLVCGLPAALFFKLAGLNLVQTIAATLLFQSVSITWLQMTFLSAAKDYEAIVRAFALGYGLSLAAALAGAGYYELNGLLWGFAIGQITLATLLGIRIFIEFKSDTPFDTAVFATWKGMPWLLLTGFAYNAGIWIDKMIFWISPRGQVIQGWFRFDPAYDTCIYLSYLTIVPTMTIFLIQIETAFYTHYAAYYEAVTQRGSLAGILRQKTAMMTDLRESAYRLLKTQGFTTIAIYLLAPLILDLLQLPAYQLPIFRICLLAAFVQALLLLTLIILLYFDWRKDVGELSLLFLLLNGGLSFLSLQLPLKYQGTGYLTAVLITLTLALITLEQRMHELERDTFTRQPFTT